MRGMTILEEVWGRPVIVEGKCAKGGAVWVLVLGPRLLVHNVSPVELKLHSQVEATFVDLCNEAHHCRNEALWLDGIELRAIFHGTCM